jgi:hypothetical protein
VAQGHRAPDEQAQVPEFKVQYHKKVMSKNVQWLKTNVHLSDSYLTTYSGVSGGWRYFLPCRNLGIHN